MKFPPPDIVSFVRLMRKHGNTLANLGPSGIARIAKHNLWLTEQALADEFTRQDAENVALVTVPNTNFEKHDG